MKYSLKKQDGVITATFTVSAEEWVLLWPAFQCGVDVWVLRKAKLRTVSGRERSSTK